MANDLRERTKRFAVAVIEFVAMLPQKQEFWIVGRQLIRCATSVGANYRAACRGKSRADFIAKLGIVEEEADECMYWLEILESIKSPHLDKLNILRAEANEILSIIIASKKTARKNAE
jgi:four helix bundle protein